MTKTKLFGIIATTVVASALFGVTMISESESQLPTPPTSNDAVIMKCDVNTLGSQYLVKFASTSTNAPTISTGAGTECAQALADLADANFVIVDVQGNSFGNILQYTLER